MTRLLGSTRMETLAKEESVRGVLVRNVLKQAEHADSEEMELLEKSLQLLLTRFQSLEVDAP